MTVLIPGVMLSLSQDFSGESNNICIYFCVCKCVNCVHVCTYIWEWVKRISQNDTVKSVCLPNNFFKCPI